MEKRSEIKKREKQQKNEKRKFICYLIVCTVLFLGAIYITDRSVSSLIMSGENRHALGLEMNNQSSVMKIEIAGEKYSVNVKEVRNIINIADQHIKGCLQRIENYIKSKD